jgi:glutamine amidotransferase
MQKINNLITIIKYKKSGNIGSLVNCIKYIRDKNKLNFKIKITRKIEVIRKSKILILPGVGHFDEVMKDLNKSKIDNEIIKFCKSKNKTLIGICIGMHILFEDSEEGKSRGLGLLKGSVKKIRNSKTLPIIGWKNTKKIKQINLIKNLNDKSYFYYLHSYESLPKDKKSIIMKCNYKNFEVNSVVASKNIIGLQFHPELSSFSGITILSNIINKMLKEQKK